MSLVASNVHAEMNKKKQLFALDAGRQSSTLLRAVNKTEKREATEYIHSDERMRMHFECCGTLVCIARARFTR